MYVHFFRIPSKFSTCRTVFYYVQLVKGEDEHTNTDFTAYIIISILFIRLPQWLEWHDGNCYKFFPQQLTWDSARSVCSDIGGDLALPTSQTNQYISTFARKNRSQQTLIGVFR